MIIGRPAVSLSPEEVTASATVEMETPGAGLPPMVSFTFPERFAPFVAEGGDGFAAALLPLAMRNRESLTIRADLSDRLVRGLREYQRLQRTWKPDFFGEVEVRCDGVTRRDPAGPAGAVGASFSGGVDSFHTLWSHLAANEPLAASRVSHFVLINGFDSDTDITGRGRFAPLERLYAGMADRLGIDFFVMRTNLMQFVTRPVNKQAFSTFIAAPGLLLGSLFARYYVPSSCQFAHMTGFPDGSHAALDHLIATEATETIHDGAHLTRVEKTIALAEWPETYDLLRVCASTTGVQQEREAVANCCVCEKCLRTMTTLELAGALSKYRCFPKPRDRRRMRRLDYTGPGMLVFPDEIIEYATRQGRRDVVRDLRRSLWRSAHLLPPVRRLALASQELERRSRLWTAMMRVPKWLLRRAGIGEGWLYWSAGK